MPSRSEQHDNTIATVLKKVKTLVCNCGTAWPGKRKTKKRKKKKI